MLARHGAEGMTDGYFAARDGRMLFLFVRARNASQDFEVLGPFIDRVKAVAAATAAKAGAAGRTPPQVGLTGLPAIEYEEHTAVQRDITLVIGTAAALIGLLILMVVRSVRWALCIFVPMGFGALWGLALALLTVGHLTLMTSAFLAILFGLGADYGIFTSSRIAEERRTGKPLVEAIAIGIGSSFRAVLTAGGGALVIFGALGTVDFPGFAELGVVAAGGVSMILISTWMVQPALYALLPPELTAVPKERTPARVSSRVPRISHDGGYGAWSRPAVVTVIVVAVVGAAGGAVRGFTIPFDYDVLALLPEDSPAAHYQRRMVAESDYQAEVVIFTAADLAEARRITEEAGRLDSIARVQSLTNLFPPDAEARLRKARDIGASAVRADLVARIGAIEREGLPDPTFQRLRKLLEQGLDTIDSSQEQAFSAGHATLVERLEQLRGRIEAIRDAIDRDAGHGRERSERFLRALVEAARAGLQVIDTWRRAEALTPDRLPPTLRERFFAADGTVAVYAFPAESVYDPAYLDRLMKEVYGVSKRATGFPTTHHVFSKAVVEGFIHGTLLAVVGLFDLADPDAAKPHGVRAGVAAALDRRGLDAGGDVFLRPRVQLREHHRPAAGDRAGRGLRRVVQPPLARAQGPHADRDHPDRRQGDRTRGRNRAGRARRHQRGRLPRRVDAWGSTSPSGSCAVSWRPCSWHRPSPSCWIRGGRHEGQSDLSITGRPIPGGDIPGGRTAGRPRARRGRRAHPDRGVLPGRSGQRKRRPRGHGCHASGGGTAGPVAGKELHQFLYRRDGRVQEAHGREATGLRDHIAGALSGITRGAPSDPAGPTPDQRE